jgi:hypothetical protein
MTRQDRPENGPSAIDKARTLLGSQIRARLTTRELVERIDSSANRPRRDLLPPTERASLVEAVTGPLRAGTYLEIGFGYDPYYTHVRTPRVFSEQSPYLGVDGRGSDGYLNGGGPMAINAQRHARDLIQQGLPPHVSLIIGDGRSLDLPDRSVQEIFMGDVIVSAGMRVEAMYTLFREARRVLDPETGTLVIREGDVIDPGIDSADPSQMYRERFAELGLALDLAGFKQRILLDEMNGEDAEAIATQFGEDLLGKQYIIAQPKDIPVVDKPTRSWTIWPGRRR